MPIRPKARFEQATHGLLSQVTVLKTTSGKHDALAAHLLRHSDNGLDQGIMKTAGDDRQRHAGSEIRQQRVETWLPIENERERGSCQRQVIGCWIRRISDKKLKVHCRLAFEANSLAHPYEGGHGVKEATDTRRQWRVELPHKHLFETIPLS